MIVKIVVTMTAEDSTSHQSFARTPIFFQNKLLLHSLASPGGGSRRPLGLAGCYALSGAGSSSSKGMV